MTPDEQIEHEQQIAAILLIRKGRPAQESTLGTWLNSNVLTALVTVIGTAILGAWVSGIIQGRAKKYELDRNRREAQLSHQNEVVNGFTAPT
jgi:hypothetical protein